MGEAKTYEGGCHCGNVRYEVTTDLGHITNCNCSICASKALLLNFVAADKFKLKKGEDSLSEYLFNKKKIHHLFCKSCGQESFATGAKPDGSKMYAINVRCLDGVDVSSLKLTPFDGKSI